MSKKLKLSQSEEALITLATRIKDISGMADILDRYKERILALKIDDAEMRNILFDSSMYISTYKNEADCIERNEVSVTISR